jgi:alpha-beta hydrolase superfamily lysophospholipase
VANKLKLYFGSRQLLISIMLTVAFAYTSGCLFLFFRQRHFIFRPSSKILALPSSSDFKMPYQEVQIPVANSEQYLHSWWVPAPADREQFYPIPNEPAKVIKSRRTILYLCGAGGNKSYYNNLARVQAMRQLGFSVLVIDYRGFGSSKGQFPTELQIYQDSQAAWDYLVKTRQISARTIVIYGESLGGAVALNLAIKNPLAKAVIVQSSLTTMADVIKQKDWLRLFPIDAILTERFDSLTKVRSLQIPILFIHGTADDVVPSYMTEQLYKAAPEPKQIFLIQGARHYAIYQPGNNSYLRSIENFMKKIDAR